MFHPNIPYYFIEQYTPKKVRKKEILLTDAGGFYHLAGTNRGLADFGESFYATF
jgi:hypothetical protein